MMSFGARTEPSGQTRVNPPARADLVDRRIFVKCDIWRQGFAKPLHHCSRLDQGTAVDAHAALIESCADDSFHLVLREALVLDAECLETVGHVVEMRFARRGGGDVDLTPIVPLAADPMLFDDIAQITLSGLEQPVAVLRRVEILDAAVAVMFQHETGVASGRAVADPHGFDDGDAIVGTELR